MPLRVNHIVGSHTLTSCWRNFPFPSLLIQFHGLSGIYFRLRRKSFPITRQSFNSYSQIIHALPVFRASSFRTRVALSSNCFGKMRHTESTECVMSRCLHLCLLGLTFLGARHQLSNCLGGFLLIIRNYCFLIMNNITSDVRGYKLSNNKILRSRCSAHIKPFNEF